MSVANAMIISMKGKQAFNCDYNSDADSRSDQSLSIFAASSSSAVTSTPHWSTTCISCCTMRVQKALREKKASRV